MEGCGKVKLATQYQSDRKYSAGYICLECSRRVRWSRLTPEQKAHGILKRGQATAKWKSDNPQLASEIAKKARASRVTPINEIRKKQQESISSDPVRYAAYCEKRRTISQEYHDSLTDKDKTALYQKVFKGTPSSQAEVQFFDVLRSRGINFDLQQCFSGFFPDGIDNKSKVIVEFYGDTFHCNPSIYKDPDQYCSWIGRTVGAQWARDRKRLGVFYSKGYRVVIVWQSEWIKNPEEQIRRIQSIGANNET